MKINFLPYITCLTIGFALGLAEGLALPKKEKPIRVEFRGITPTFSWYGLANNGRTNVVTFSGPVEISPELKERFEAAGMIFSSYAPVITNYSITFIPD